MAIHPSQCKTGYTPPWSTPDQWKAANDAMTAALGTRRHRFAPIRDLAVQIEARLISLDRFMDDLCAATCPGCMDNCCERATVWYDFKDLLRLHLCADIIPAEQLIPLPKRPCQHLGPMGCALPRNQRPFICTYYLCTAQRQAMMTWAPSHQHYLMNSLMALKSGRNRMEALFIQQVVR